MRTKPSAGLAHDVGARRSGNVSGSARMNITLKLYASLGQFLPEGASRNIAEIEVEDGATIDTILTRWSIPRASCHLVLLNGVFQPPASWARVELNAGDALAIWPPIAGG